MMAVTDDGDQLADGDCRAFGDEEPLEDAFVVGFQLHRGLVGLDLGEHVALADGIALFLEPLAEHALRHGVRQAGHEYVGHDCLLPGEPGGIEDLADELGQGTGVGERGALEGLGVGQRDLGGGDAPDRGV